jgi:hypothetical protein
MAPGYLEYLLSQTIDQQGLSIEEFDEAYAAYESAKLLDLHANLIDSYNERTGDQQPHLPEPSQYALETLGMVEVEVRLTAGLVVAFPGLNRRGMVFSRS